jgi:hypothetical protein
MTGSLKLRINMTHMADNQLFNGTSTYQYLKTASRLIDDLIVIIESDNPNNRLDFYNKSDETVRLIRNAISKYKSVTERSEPRAGKAYLE